MHSAKALRSQLTTLQKDILDELCEARTTRNAVVLTLDLVNRRRILRFGDPYALVKDCIVQLNVNGLCVYTEGDHGVPINIRPTQDGYHAAGHLLVSREVGTRSTFRNRYRSDDASARTGDGTDFRNINYRTTGGPIERMPIAAHLAKYPDHHHYLIEETDAMSTYPKYDPETIQRVVDLRASGRTWPEIATSTGIPRGTISSPGSVFGKAFRGEKLPTKLIEKKEESMAGGSNTHPVPTPEQASEIVELIRLGKRTSDITAITGFGTAAIGTAAKAAGIYRGAAGKIITAEEAAARVARQPKAPVMVGDTLTEMLRQADEGVTAPELARRFGVNDQTIRNALHKNGWAPSGRGRPLTPPSGGPRTLSVKDRHAEMARVPATPEPSATQLTMKESANWMTLLRRIVNAKQVFHDVGVLTKKASSWPDVTITGHEITHILFDLKKDGYVTFRETNTGGAMRIQRIRPTPKAERFIRQLDGAPNGNQNEKPQPKPFTSRGALTPTIVAVVDGDQVTGKTLLGRRETAEETVSPLRTVNTPPPPAEPPTTVSASPDPGRWPILAALLERLAKGAKAKAKAERYFAAASLLEDDPADKLMVDALLSAATDLAETARMTPAEEEYLAFSEWATGELRR